MTHKIAGLGSEIMANGASRAYAETTSFVNVAEARPKLTIEPPLIGDTVVQALMASLWTQDPEAADGPTLILGYGAIGRAVARALAGSGAGTSRQAIHVYDPEPSAASEAQRDGFDTWDRTCVPPVQYRLVIGCSGTSFGVGDRRSLADGAVLVSAELSRERFIELADTHTQDDIWVHDREMLSDRDIHTTDGEPSHRGGTWLETGDLTPEARVAIDPHPHRPQPEAPARKVLPLMPYPSGERGATVAAEVPHTKRGST